MEYLVFAIFVDGGDQVATYSKDMDLGTQNPGDMAEDIIADIAATGLGRDSLWEVFVFQSAKNFRKAPNLIAYWDQDDGLF